MIAFESYGGFVFIDPERLVDVRVKDDLTVVVTTLLQNGQIIEFKVKMGVEEVLAALAPGLQKIVRASQVEA